MKKKDKVNLTLGQWATCYAGALGFGGLTWWATGNSWLGAGVLIAFTAAYVFWLAGRSDSKAASSPSRGVSRQQKRELKRKGKI
jgi:hypothetical protein